MIGDKTGDFVSVNCGLNGGDVCRGDFIVLEGGEAGWGCGDLTAVWRGDADEWGDPIGGGVVIFSSFPTLRGLWAAEGRLLDILLAVLLECCPYKNTFCKKYLIQNNI